MSRRFALLIAAFCIAACAAPPSREMDQAQGAIDAARAARADRYATTEYEAAVKALKQAHDAVAQRDYRLALNYARDSRTRAHNAAKEAVDQQATLRSGAERRLGELTALLDQANRRLAAADSARVPRRTLAAPRAAIAAANASLQKAGTEILEGDYHAGQKRLSDSAEQLQKAIADLEAAMKTRGGRGRS